MKRVIIVALGLVAFVAAVPAQAPAKITGTYYVCYENYATSKGKTKKHRGTTKIHIHKVKPSPKHYRRHHCRKVVTKPKTVTKIVYVPSPPQVVYVDRPCNCQPPEPPPCEQDCQPKHHGHNRGCKHSD